MDEERLVSFLRSKFKYSKGSSIIGDDAAVLPYKGKESLLFAADTIIESRHFTKKSLSPYYIGRKAVAVNISDIAAMGGEPLYAVVNLGIEKLDRAFISKLYKGIGDIAKKYNIKIVGGDTVKSRYLFLAVAMVAKVKNSNITTRSGAKEGDNIYVTGTIGGATLSSKHYKFTPRLRDALWLGRNFKINSMIDVTDGLAIDLSRICKASDKGAVLEKSSMPFSSRVSSFKKALEEGEDFELLFTASSIMNIPKYIPESGLKVTLIGNIVGNKRGVFIRDSKKVKSLKIKGYDHFK
jgi:thiamine-monophosphate kinase